MSKRKMVLHNLDECRVARADLLASATGYTGDLPEFTRLSNDENELSRTMSRTLGEVPSATTYAQILDERHPDDLLELPLDAAHIQSDTTIWKTSEDNDIGEQHQQRSDPPALVEPGSQAEPSEIHHQYASLTANQTTESIGQNGQYNQIVDSAEAIKQSTNETAKLNATNQPDSLAPIQVTTFSGKPLGKPGRRKKKRKQRPSTEQPANKMITYVSSVDLNSIRKQQQRIIYKPNLKQHLVEGHNHTSQMSRWYRLPSVLDALSNQTASNISDLATQTSVLLNSAVRGPFHLDNDRELANYNRLWNTRNPSSSNDGETATASSSEANSFVDLAQPESPVTTGSSPGISPDHEHFMLNAGEDPDSTDSELELDHDYPQDYTNQEPKTARGNSANEPKGGSIQSSTSVEGKLQQTNVVEMQVQRGPRTDSGQKIKPQTNEPPVLQDHLETASQLNATTTGAVSLAKPGRQATVAAALSHELLVGPFKSESEAPATITLEGVVYQKSGASSALIKSEPAKQNKSPGESDGLSASGSSSAVSSSSSSSAAPNGGQQTSALSLLPSQANVAWPTPMQLNQPTLDGSSIQLTPNNNVLYGSIKSLNADQIATAVGGQQHSPQALFSDPGATNNHLISAMDFRPTPIQSGIGSLLSMLSPFSSHSAHQFVVANPPTAHPATASLDTIEQLKQLHLFKQKYPSQSLEKLTLPGGGLSVNHQGGNVAIGESLASSSSGGQDPRGTTTIWVGKNNPSIMNHLSPSAAAAAAASGHLNSNELQQMLASESAKYTHSGKEKGGPIVLVQKDVKPVKYHLLRAYLKLRRLLRPAEATYVFPNDSSGFLRRWLSKRSQSS